MSPRKRREIIQYIAADLRRGDVIRVKDQSHSRWFVVKSIYVGEDGAKALRQLAEEVLEGYKAKTISNVGVALFINQNADENARYRESRLDRVEAELGVVVEIRRRLDRYESDNWIEFPAVGLIDVQVMGE